MPSRKSRSGKLKTPTRTTTSLAELALEARLMADRLRFGDQTPHEHPMARWYFYNRIGQYAESAKSAGDMVTYHRLTGWVAKQRALARMRQFQQGSPGSEVNNSVSTL